MQKNNSKLLSLLGLFVLLSGCAEYRLRELEEMTPEGTPFTKALTENYKQFAKNENDMMRDDIDAAWFASKAIGAAEGKNMLPENPENWDIPPQHLPELKAAYQRLLTDLRGGGRGIAPQEAAAAQVFYDCWVEEQEEGWQHKFIQMCRTGFMDNIAIVESKMNPPAPKAAPNVPPAFVVLFPLNSDKIDAEGMKVIQKAVAASHTQQGYRIYVFGRTDGIGKKQHNTCLSTRRAMAVKRALEENGVKNKEIYARGLGEMPGKQVEPDNRRADILWEDHKMNIGKKPCCTK